MRSRHASPRTAGALANPVQPSLLSDTNGAPHLAEDLVETLAALVPSPGSPQPVGTGPQQLLGIRPRMGKHLTGMVPAVELEELVDGELDQSFATRRRFRCQVLEDFGGSWVSAVEKAEQLGELRRGGPRRLTEEPEEARSENQPAGRGEEVGSLGLQP